MNNCEETVYDFNVASRALDIEELCQKGSSTREVCV